VEKEIVNEIKALLSFLWRWFARIGMLGGTAGLVFDRFVEGALAGWVAALILLPVARCSVVKALTLFAVPIFLTVLGAKLAFFTPTIHVEIPREVALYGCAPEEVWSCEEAAEQYEHTLNNSLNWLAPRAGMYVFGLGVILLLWQIIAVTELGYSLRC